MLFRSETMLFSGHGRVTANGGNGHGYGGGGAGGRIAVHVAWLREYAGLFGNILVIYIKMDSILEI